MRNIVIFLFLFVCHANLSAQNGTEKGVEDSVKVEKSCEKYDSGLSVDSVKNEINNLDMDKQEKMSDRVKKGMISILIVVGIGLLMIIAFIIVGIRKVCTLLEKKIGELQDELRAKRYQERYEGKEFRNASCSSSSVRTERKINNLEQGSKDVKNHISGGERLLENPIARQSIEEDRIPPSVAKEEGLKSIYAKPMQDGRLKVTNEIQGAIYVIRCKTNDSVMGEFEVYQGREQMLKAIKNKENFIDIFCEVKGNSINACAVKNLNSGEVKKVDGSTWEVVRKAKIEFIK